MTDLGRLRVGHGFDVHPYSDDPSRVLVLGGEVFPGERGLVGHSDADAIAHAVVDAVAAAAGLGDIGSMFPDTDPALSGADSVVLLAEAAGRVRAAGWHIVNVDATLVADHPKLAPVRERIQARLSEALGAPVTVKGKRTEGIAGLQGGIRCDAVALLLAPEPIAGAGDAESNQEDQP